MELYLLEYLVAFRDCGTVEAAARQLNVTAPTVSRGLKKLESELGTQLLDRTPARMQLNATGLFAADRAEALLRRAQDFGDSVREFERDHAALRVAAEVPGVLCLLDAYPHATTPQEGYIGKNEAPDLLASHRADLVVTTVEHNEHGLESVFLGRDTLVAKLTDINALHDRDSLCFEDLAGQEFVLPRDMGAWNDVIRRNAPHTLFLYQDSEAAFRELVRYSNFPVLRTLLTLEADDGFRSRKGIALSDDSATLELYATYRASEHDRLASAVRFLSQQVEKTTQQAMASL